MEKEHRVRWEEERRTKEKENWKRQSKDSFIVVSNFCCGGSFTERQRQILRTLEAKHWNERMHSKVGLYLTQRGPTDVHKSPKRSLPRKEISFVRDFSGSGVRASVLFPMYFLCPRWNSQHQNSGFPRGSSDTLILSGWSSRVEALFKMFLHPRCNTSVGEEKTLQSVAKHMCMDPLPFPNLGWD